MLCDFLAPCMLSAGQDLPKSSELVQPWNLPEGQDQPQRGELDQVSVPTLQVEGVGQIPSSVSIPCSQTKIHTSPEMLPVKRPQKALCPGAAAPGLSPGRPCAQEQSPQARLPAGPVPRSGHPRSISQQTALTITCRVTLDFSKLDLRMASRNFSGLKTQKLPGLGKPRIRRKRHNSTEPGKSRTKMQTAGSQTV